MNLFKSFLREENGQDLIEYTLLLAFVALVAAAIFINVGGEVSGIWTLASSQLANANSSAGS